MTDNRNGDNETNERLSIVGLAMGLGFSIAVPLTLGVIGGVWLDGVLNTKPLFILLGIFFGLFATGYAIWRLLDLSGKRANRK